MCKDEYLQLSGIQHFAFCKRQWGLIHIDRIWEDNDLTASGNIVHRNVDEGNSKETRKDLQIMRSVKVASNELRLSGICDVVEIRKVEDGKLEVFPLEYKHGSPKRNDCDRVQLCAQAMALEEMFELPVTCGAIYYHTTRRRENVPMSDNLRNLTRTIAEEMHRYFEKGKVPAPKFESFCMSCSLYNRCLPETTCGRSSVKNYFRNKRKLIQ
jgi:CRISPR-associated exonuclease Cas4